MYVKVNQRDQSVVNNVHLSKTGGSLQLKQNNIMFSQKL